MAYNPKTGDYEGMGEYETKISNIKLGMGDFEISIAQIFTGGKLMEQEVALISPNRDYEIHPFYDLESLIEVLTAINKASYLSEPLNGSEPVYNGLDVKNLTVARLVCLNGMISNC